MGSNILMENKLWNYVYETLNNNTPWSYVLPVGVSSKKCE